MLRLLILLILLSSLACSTQSASNANTKIVEKLMQDPLTEEETLEVLDQSAKNWFYGTGLGDTAFKIGTSVVFPPVVLLWLTDFGLEASGAGSLSLKPILPQATADNIISGYHAVVSVPGKVTAAVAGHEFRQKEKGSQILMNVLNSHENPIDLSDV